MNKLKEYTVNIEQVAIIFNNSVSCHIQELGQRSVDPKKLPTIEDYEGLLDYFVRTTDAFIESEEKKNVSGNTIISLLIKLLGEVDQLPVIYRDINMLELVVMEVVTKLNTQARSRLISN